MKQRIIIFFTIITLVTWASEAGAFEFFSPGNCSDCHSQVFAGGPGSIGHQAHNGLGLPDGCNTCHIDTGDDPPLDNCVQCHVEAGLREHHRNAEASTCAGCHSSTEDQANLTPENTPVPGYATLTNAVLDPCDGTEELFGPNVVFGAGSFTVSLDNDGDLLYDGDDPDCAIDPCEGIVCETPAPCEIGPGTCIDGNCFYDPVACDTPGVCEIGPGNCADDVCTYDPVVCDSPDTAACETGPGTCADDVCTYPACGPGEACEGGQCVASCPEGDPCDDQDPCTVGDICGPNNNCIPGSAVVCNTPGDCQELPGSCVGGTCEYAAVVCDTPNAALCETGPGTCVDNACQYGSACDPATEVCQDGNCVPGDPCTGVICDTPGICEVGPGTCVDGVCNYDPVVCDQPNTTLCEVAPGTCVDNVCQYDSACDPATEVCQDGNCVPGDPCTGVVCDTPGICEVGPGTCVDGVCNYDPVVCDSPDAAACEVDPGTCVDDVCQYDSACDPATEVCQDGVCVPEPTDTADVKLQRFHVPMNIKECRKVGKDIAVSVKNLGDVEVTGDVTLYKDGVPEIIWEDVVFDLIGGRRTNLIFTYLPDPEDTGKRIEWQAVVDVPGDPNPSNNTSRVKKMKVKPCK